MSDVIQWLVIVIGVSVVGYCFADFFREQWRQRGHIPLPWWEHTAAAEIEKAKHPPSSIEKAIYATVFLFPVWGIALVLALFYLT